VWVRGATPLHSQVLVVCALWLEIERSRSNLIVLVAILCPPNTAWVRTTSVEFARFDGHLRLRAVGWSCVPFGAPLVHDRGIESFRGFHFAVHPRPQYVSSCGDHETHQVVPAVRMSRSDERVRGLVPAHPLSNVRGEAPRQTFAALTRAISRVNLSCFAPRLPFPFFFCLRWLPDIF
jgi:hypothetical protein